MCCSIVLSGTAGPAPPGSIFNVTNVQFGVGFGFNGTATTMMWNGVVQIRAPNAAFRPTNGIGAYPTAGCVRASSLSRVSLPL